MSDVPRDDKPKVFTLINGEIRESRISFSSVSDLDGENRVHTVEGERIDVQVPGASFSLSFDLDEVQKVPAAVEREPTELVKETAAGTITPFQWKTLLIAFVLWNVVGYFFGVLGFFVATGYFCYQWRRAVKHNKQLAGESQTQPETPQAPSVGSAGGSKMSRATVRQALSRKR